MTDGCVGAAGPAGAIGGIGGNGSSTSNESGTIFMITTSMIVLRAIKIKIPGQIQPFHSKIPNPISHIAPWILLQGPTSFFFGSLLPIFIPQPRDNFCKLKFIISSQTLIHTITKFPGSGDTLLFGYIPNSLAILFSTLFLRSRSWLREPARSARLAAKPSMFRVPGV